MYFSTLSTKSSDKKGAWLEAWTSVCGKFEVDFGGGDFIGEIDTRKVCGLDAIRHMQTCRGARRTQSTLPLEDFGYYLILQCAGRSNITAGREEIVLSPGKVALIDSLSSIRSKYSGKNITISYHIPREELEGRSGIRLKSSILLAPHDSNPFLYTFLNSAFAMNTLIEENAATSFRNFLFDFIVSCTSSNPVMDFAVPASDGGLNARIKQFLLSNLANQNLSPALISSEFNVSQRQVHRAFETEGTSLCRWIKKTRLHNCALALRQKGESSRTITDIAFDLGFSDLPHFSRAFREEFGMSPSEYRNQHSAARAASLC